MCCLSHTVCGTLSWQPLETNTGPVEPWPLRFCLQVVHTIGVDSALSYHVECTVGKWCRESASRKAGRARRAATMSFTSQFLAQNLHLNILLLNQTEYQAKQAALCQASNRWRAWVGWCFPLRSYLPTVLMSHCQESQCRKITTLCIVT